MSEKIQEKTWMDGVNRAVETIASREIPPGPSPPSKEAKKMMDLMNETMYAVHRQALDAALKAAQSTETIIPKVRKE